MKRLLPIFTLALLGLSACDSGTLISPMEPEVGEPSFAKVVLPAFEPQEGCPDGKTCLVDPTVLVREKGAPSSWVSEPFAGAEGQMATLVVQASNPKTTTMKAWLNGETVLLPSVIPQEWPKSVEEPQEVRVSFPLADGDNVLEVRLSAKPGTQVVFWVESEVVAPAGPPPPPPPEFDFELTEELKAPTDDLNAACAELNTPPPLERQFVIADWDQVVAAVASGMAKEDIMNGEMAMILNGGSAFYSPGFLLEDQHYMISAVGAGTPNHGSVGSDLFWLTSGTTSQPVLCIATP